MLFFHQVNNDVIMDKINNISSQEVQQALEITPRLSSCILHIESQTFVEAIEKSLKQENILDCIRLNPVLFHFYF